MLQVCVCVCVCALRGAWNLPDVRPLSRGTVMVALRLVAVRRRWLAAAFCLTVVAEPEAPSVEGPL